MANDRRKQAVENESKDVLSARSSAAAERGQGDPRSRSFWRDFTFLKVWSALSVSLLGSQMTLLALPLTAILWLHASVFQVGVLAATGQLPFIVFSLFAGVWVDRVRRRPVLIVTDLARAFLLGSVPLAALMGALRIEQLYVVVFLVGTCDVFFELAHYAYVPSLVGPDRLLRANSMLQFSYSAADAGGPGLAGILIQWLTAPFVILFDVFSYLISAVIVWSIRVSEPVPTHPSTAPQRMSQDITAGWSHIFSHPLLRPLLLVSITVNLFFGAIEALYLLYATRSLGLSPLLVGFIFASGGLFALVGALLAERVALRFGLGRSLFAGLFLQSGALTLVPLAAGFVTLPLLVASRALAAIAGTIWNVQQWSLRQMLTPSHVQGRVTALFRMLVWGAGGLGAFLGGIAGTVLGLRLTLLLCAAAAMLGSCWLVRSPLWHVEDLPVQSEG